MDEAHSYGVVVYSAMSEEYVSEMNRRVDLFIEQGFTRADQVLKAAGVAVHTIRAKCGNSKDEQMLVNIIQHKEGGFERLDQVIEAFRMSELPASVKETLEKMKLRNEVCDKHLVGLIDEDAGVRLSTLQKLEEHAPEDCAQFSNELDVCLKDSHGDVVEAAMVVVAKLSSEELVRFAPQLAARLEHPLGGGCDWRALRQAALKYTEDGQLNQTQFEKVLIDVMPMLKSPNGLNFIKGCFNVCHKDALQQVDWRELSTGL